MFTKDITSTTADKFGAQAEIEKHRQEAAKTFTNPMHVGTASTSQPSEENPDQHIYTITSTWVEGPEPDAAQDQPA